MNLVSLLVLEDTGLGGNIAEEILNKLVPNIGSFLTQLLALVVLIIGVIVLGYKPIRKMIDKRNNYIEQNIADAEVKNKEAEVNFKQSEEAVIASRKQANELLVQAKNSALEEKERILEEARQESLKIKQDAEKDIERSREEAKESIRQEMVQVALEASKELLKREVNSKDNERLVEDFIKGIDA